MQYCPLFLRVATLLVVICINGFAHAGALTPFNKNDVPLTPDYTLKASWLALPADSDQYPVDIFWVYPTVLHNDSHWLMDVSAPESIQMALPTLVRQASVFSGLANLYAPLYRQMNMAALSLSPAEQNALIKYGMGDVWQAFNYYLTHYNQGRPFILAGHSQGSNVLTNLALKHWGSLGIEKKLIAAYLIGWSITPENLKENPALTMCESATQTNCFIAYNTLAAGHQDAAPTRIKGTFVTNPLTWKTSGEFAAASLNIGARFFKADGSSEFIPHFTSAQVINSGLVVQPADESLVDSGSATFPKGVYHPFDYSLFYENIKENAKQRIETFTTRKQ